MLTGAMWCLSSYSVPCLQAMHYLGIPTTRGTTVCVCVCVRACMRACVHVCTHSSIHMLLPLPSVLSFLCNYSWHLCDIRHSCGAGYPIRWSPQDGASHHCQPHSTDLSEVTTRRYHPIHLLKWKDLEMFLHCTILSCHVPCAAQFS